MDRNILIRAMIERGVREGLVIRIEMLRETKRVREGKQCSGEFWFVRGGKVISPTLFNTLTADMEDCIKKR